MLARFALALDVSADEILGLKEAVRPKTKVRGRRLLRRLEDFEKLPKREQDAVLRTLDAFLARAS